MFSKLKSDIPSSIVVFLVALPLCLGIALASGAPMLSGVIAGIIGGIVVGLLSESHVSVSGPAAGLAAVVLAAINELSSFDTFLLAVLIAGCIQVIAGVLKGGLIANYIPSNVIKGLLAAIGIILIIKQVPHAIGYDRTMQGEGKSSFSELLNFLPFVSWGAIIISLLSIFIMIYWDKTPMKKIKFFPASLFVVVLGVALNMLFQHSFPSIAISPKHLVNIPAFTGINSLFTFPNFQAIGNYHVWIIAFTIAIVASLETLLNLEAVENIDPHKRQASPNRELIAQGIGNVFSGLAGGLPITSVIVRSSVNINAGGETKLSAILHGIFLLISILLLSPILNLIPLASLASILLLTGYKLAKISLFKDMYSKGFNQFIPFIATILAIVFTDLLIGVFIGLAISIFYLLKSNYKNAFTIETPKHTGKENLKMVLSEEVSFLNKASIKEALIAIPENSALTIDASRSTHIDYDVIEIISDFISVQSKEKNIRTELIGFSGDFKLSNA